MRTRLTRLTRLTFLSLTLGLALPVAGVTDARPPSTSPRPPLARLGRSPIGPGLPRALDPEVERFGRPLPEAAIDAWIDGALDGADQADPYQAVDTCVEREMLDTETPGASVAIMLDGQVVHAKGYGVKSFGEEDPVDATTMFRIGSTTKMMVAAGIMQMVEQGKADLRAPITTYIPDLDLADPWDPETITLHHLLTHSAGIPDRLAGADLSKPPPVDPKELANWAKTLGDWPLYAPPGSFWNYSNPSWSLAGLILENTSGMGYRDYIEEKVWRPARMPLTTIDPNDVMEHGNYTFGHEVDPVNGGLYIDPQTGKPKAYAPNSYDSGWAGPAGFAFSTPTEMVTWAELLMDGGGAVLSKASADAMQGRQMTMDYTPDDYYGYGVFLAKYRGVETRDHGGNIPGWSSQLIWVPERKLAVSVLANTIQSLTGSAYCAVREVLRLEPVAPPDYSTDPETWRKYAGTYDFLLYDGRRFPAWVVWSDGTLETVMALPEDLTGTPFPIRGPLKQAALDTFFTDFDGDGTPAGELVFTFIADPNERSTIRWMRHRSLVGTRGADQPVPTAPPATPTTAVTATPTGAPPATPTPTLTPRPRPIYLPVLLKDRPCEPVVTYLDVVFVIDGSAYMKDLREGRPAWDLALDMARNVVEFLDFSPDARGQSDRAGAVVFRHRDAPESGEILGLAGNAGTVTAFLNRLELGDPRDTARIDVGLNVGRNLVTSAQGRKDVLILLSELQAKNVPYRHIEACANRRSGQEECAVLSVADSIKSDGVTIAVFATGTDARGGQELPAVASDRSLFLVRPSASQISDVIRRLGPRAECPRSSFWPYQP